MNFLKKNLKLFIAFIIGAILACGITVYANNILASQITYTNNKTVEQALNELYGKKEYVSGQVTATEQGVIVNTLDFQPSLVIFYDTANNHGLIKIVNSSGSTYWLTCYPASQWDGYVYNDNTNNYGCLTSNGFADYSITAGTYNWIALK